MTNKKIRVVRDLSKYNGCGIVYDKANGYFQTDPNAVEFQLGRELYDTQVLVASVQKAREFTQNLADVDMHDIEKMLIAHCRLINLVGYLRTEYSAALDVLQGRAEYREAVEDAGTS